AGPVGFCSGGSVVLNANTGSGYSYIWKRNGSAISGATGSSYTATLAGSHTVTITSGSCSAVSNAINLSVGNTPNAEITLSGATSLCGGGSVTMTTPAASGQVYIWRNYGTEIVGATTNTYTTNQPGGYTVSVFNGGCFDTSDPVFLSAGAATMPAISADAATTFCAGGNVLLRTTPVSGSIYQWRRNGAVIGGASSSSYTATLAGTYTVTVTSGSCSGTSTSLAVTVHALPVISCSANPGNGTVSAVASGGQAPYAYTWNTQPAQTTATATVSSSGTYSVTVTNANGCRANCTTSIALPSASNCQGIHSETETAWGAEPAGNNPGAYMTAHFDDAFSYPGHISIGCGFRRLRLTSAQAVTDFLPSSGWSDQLPFGFMTDPAWNYGNLFAGELVALKLTVRFDELYPDFSGSSTLLKNMVIASGPFAGWSVQQLINESDRKIGGCSNTYSANDLNAAITEINDGYQGGDMDSGFLVCPTNSVIQAGLPVDEPDSWEDALGVQAFPNPFQGATTLSISGANGDAVTTIEIHTLQGVLVERIFQGTIDQADDHRVRWDASDLARGAYICKVLNGERVAQGRLMVQ
ncbi:MAG: T9SS type A sorting domain-containing protein, partial [Flavobacteriales bacterium]|nr:T9SS type A sorting domain-containing protein [Flavobacteriales bacterium]